MNLLWTSGGASGSGLPVGGHFILRVIPGGTVWPFANKTEMVLKAVASFNKRQVKGVDIHGIGISSWAGILRAGNIVGVAVLWSRPSMHESHFTGDLLLEAEMNGFIIPSSDGSGDSVHGLNAVHQPGWQPG